MKSWIMKAVASAALKNAISYAYKASLLIHAALQGVLDDGNVSDQHRANLTLVITAVVSIRDFLSKLVVLFGVSSGTIAALPAFPLGNALNDAITGLNNATESL